MKKQITLNQLKALVMEVRKKPTKDPFEDFEMDDTGVIVKYIGNDEAVVIPDGVRSIGDRAFAGCSSLKSIIIPSGVEVIRPLAFLNCENLTSVSFPDTLRLIDARAFSGCANLFKIDLPEGVELGTDCFAGTAWQREKNRILSSKLERCEEMDKEETLKWIKKGGLCVYRSGLSFRGAKAHPISTENALKKFPQYSFENPLYNLSWLIYNDEVALEFCELDENDMFESRKITLTVGQIKRLIKESDEVKLQMVALKRAFDEIKKGKQEAEAGNWKIEALGEWNDELDAPEHGGHWVYFKGAPILEVNYDTMEYCYLMETAILSKEMTDAMLETLECKDFSLEGDGFPDFLSGDDKEEEED